MRGGATGSIFCACPDFPRVFFRTIVVQNVVQVPWLQDVTEGHVIPKRCAHVQAEVGIFRPFFVCFRICVVLHVRILFFFL